MKKLNVSLCAVAATMSLVAAPVKIILDTDMLTDFDDVGAMACLHALADAGECEILATVSCTRGNASTAAIGVINGYYGRADIPIGCAKELGVLGPHTGAKKKLDPTSPLGVKGGGDGGHYKYRKLAVDYPQWVKYLDSDTAPDANLIYRRALAAAPDQSVVICSIGFLTNLRRLLETPPDDISPLNGRDLVARKVRKWVAMACKYPKGKEYNSQWDWESSRIAIENWPTPIVFSDWEYGADVFAGRAIAEMEGPRNPVKDVFAGNIPSRFKVRSDPAKYQSWCFGMGGRSAWDETAVLAAVRDESRYFNLHRGTYKMIGTEGENVWIPDEENGPHLRLTEKMNKLEVGKVIDELICRPPKCAAAAKTVTQYVRPEIGTEYNGHTTVAAAWPFGLVQAGPDTGRGSWNYCSGYRFADANIWGFSQTHLSGTGCPDLGDIRLQPGGVDRAYPFDKTTEKIAPGRYEVFLKEIAAKVEITVTPHAAFYRFTYTGEGPAKLLVDTQWMLTDEHNFSKCVLESQTEADPAAKTLLGSRTTKSWTTRRLGFALKTDRAWTLERLPKSDPREKGERLVLTFPDVKSGEVVLAKIGLSASGDSAKALANLEAEIPAWDFEAKREAVNAAWGKQLSVMSAEGSDDQLISFYTSLYHLFFQPNNIADVGEKPYYSTLSCWDTFRAAHPLYTIVAPEKAASFVNSMLADGRKRGYTSIWTLWGEDTQCMIGTHSVPVIVDWFLKEREAGSGDACWENAYNQIKDALTKRHDDRIKENWDLYDQYGYYPFDKIKGESVSRTLECAYDDWCAGMMAEKLGHHEDAEFFFKRSASWKNVFDPAEKLMRGRDSSGAWRTPFNPFSLGHGADVANDFTEGNSYQYTWHVMQDPAGLIAAMGGKTEFARRLDGLFTLPSKVDGAGFVSDVSGLIGQYAHGNEPSHHVIYFFQYANRGDLTAKYVREVFDKFYLPKPDGLCGNDDCGQMSAWYLFSAMGFYPFNPCGGEYVLGAPQLSKVTLRCQPQPSTSFTITAKNLSKENKYVKSVTLNGKPLDGFILKHSDIVSGGELVFTMGR